MKSAKKSTDEKQPFSFSAELPEAVIFHVGKAEKVEATDGRKLDKVTCVFKAELGKGNPLHVEFIGKAAKSFLEDGPEIYDVLNLSVNIKSRMVPDKETGEERWYTTVSCWKYDYLRNLREKSGSTKAGEKATPPPPPPPAKTADGDLPF